MGRKFFESDVVKKYPRLEEITEGLHVIAIEPSYKGLVGYIDEINAGDDMEIPENEYHLECICNLEKPEDMSDEEYDEEYKHLNGTGIDMLFMGEEDLAYDFDGNQIYKTVTGRAWINKRKKLKKNK